MGGFLETVALNLGLEGSGVCQAEWRRGEHVQRPTDKGNYCSNELKSSVTGR